MCEVQAVLSTKPPLLSSLPSSSLRLPSSTLLPSGLWGEEVSGFTHSFAH